MARPHAGISSAHRRSYRELLSLLARRRRATAVVERTSFTFGPTLEEGTAREFRFVEVKHRLHPALPASPSYWPACYCKRRTSYVAAGQIGTLDWNLNLRERALRRSQLVRVLHFYADRASRHRQPKAHVRPAPKSISFF